MNSDTFDLDDYISQRKEKKRILILQMDLIQVMKNLKSE